jgi:outer membrane protein
MTSTGLVLLVAGPNLAAQGGQQKTEVFSLPRAVTFALEHYPSVRAAIERVAAARGGVELAHTQYLPTTNLLWQSNRATANNIFGLLLPQSVLPPISGPVLANSSNSSAWGSGAGALASWEPFDFGYRRAEMNVARTGERLAGAEAELTRLDVATAVSNAFFSVLTAEQITQAARANVTRREVFDKSVHVLVANGLRPGADASRADAELAVARNQLIEAETAEGVSRAALAELLGIVASNLEIDPGPLMGPPPEQTLAAVSPAAHPAATAIEARVTQEKAREQALARSYVPHFYSQAAISGRGSGANANGVFAAGLNGLGLERTNWVAGVTVTFPLMDYFSLRGEKRIEAANQRAEEAHYEQTLQDLSGQAAEAQVKLEGARRVAANTPIELQAAREGETQARARYESGLATVVEVAEAQSLLVQAEIDDRLARLNIWLGLEGVAAAQGNLQPFLTLVQAESKGGN